jgi:hypothetical protein
MNIKRNAIAMRPARLQPSLLQTARPSIGVPLIGAGCYIITGKGDWLREADPRLATEIGFTDPKLDAIGFAVRNMGFVRVVFCGPGVLTIALHPRNVEAPAANSLVNRIDGLIVKEVNLRFLSEDKWLGEVFASAEPARRRIRTLCSGEPKMSLAPASTSAQ